MKGSMKTFVHQMPVKQMLSPFSRLPPGSGIRAFSHGYEKLIFNFVLILKGFEPVLPLLRRGPAYLSGAHLWAV